MEIRLPFEVTGTTWVHNGDSDVIWEPNTMVTSPLELNLHSTLKLIDSLGYGAILPDQFGNFLHFMALNGGEISEETLHLFTEHTEFHASLYDVLNHMRRGQGEAPLWALDLIPEAKIFEVIDRDYTLFEVATQDENGGPVVTYMTIEKARDEVRISGPEIDLLALILAGRSPATV